jgi:hypothetical protein
MDTPPVGLRLSASDGRLGARSESSRLAGASNVCTPRHFGREGEPGTSDVLVPVISAFRCTGAVAER